MEATKRIKLLLKQECDITVISNSVSKQIELMIKKRKINFKKQQLDDANFLKDEKPYMVITTTDNSHLNQKIISQAKKSKIIAYSSDNPDESDFSNPAIVEIEDIIQIAIFTGGRSPAMSKKIKEQIEKTIKKKITKEDIEQIRIQQIARNVAKEKLPTQSQRKTFLKNIMNDKEIKQLIKDKKSKKVEKRIISILREL
jgi:precorrin-2 dehydrogenase/sirohydrochlorin ferrochelatase